MRYERLRWLLTFSALGLVSISGCHNAQSARSTPAIVGRVVHLDFQKQWVICSRITVYDDRAYEWIRYPTWTHTDETIVRRGSLPDQVFRDLVATVEGTGCFEVVEGVLIYCFGIDDRKTKHPVSVIRLNEFVWRNSTLK